MLFFFTSRIVSALAAFLYPGYASYKTLSQRPASEVDLERWLMYWSVLGCVVGVEYLAEWLVSWIPFYSTLKAIFFLYLALPQTQGSTYIYIVHLRPFFAKHEGQIDMAIAEVRTKAYLFLQEKARAIWAAVINALTSGAAPDANAAGVGGGVGQIGMGNEPSSTTQNPPGGPTQLLSSLWTAYGPGIIAGGTALLRQTAAATLPSGTAPGTNTRDVKGRSNALNTPPGSTLFPSSADPIAERRRQLEAELASLSAHPSTSSIAMQMPIPPANNIHVRPGLTPSSSSSSVRERVNSGRFEEIEGHDVEGYKDERFIGGFVPGDANQPRKSTGWFGGWGSGSSANDERGSYERVKNE
jgi:receptor expression-enhancing protein 1/2/3/4